MSEQFEITTKDFTIWNEVDNPIISIDLNGTVDIGKHYGDSQRISLNKLAIIRFINVWLQKCGHELFEDDILKLESVLTTIKNK